MSRIFSPFADGGPVEPEDFVGRKDIVEKFEPYLKDCINGTPHFFLITGEPQIGKSSFLKYMSEYSKENYKTSTCSWLIEETIEKTIEELISKLLWNIKLSQENTYNKIIKDLNENIVNVGWRDIEFKKDFLTFIKENFIDFFKYLYDKINNRPIFKKYNGLIIQLEPYWGSDFPLFLEWFANIIRECNATNIELPFLFMLSLSKEDYDKFIDDEIAKYFIIDELKPLSDEEVREYFKNSFNKFNWEISDEILDLIVMKSCGRPNLMQHIGNEIYYSNTLGAFDDLEEKGYRTYGYVDGVKLDDLDYVIKILDKMEL